MSEEEARRRKIILDGQVAGVAAAGILACEAGELSPEQLEALIDLDTRYLEEASRICPSLVTRVHR